MGKGGGSSSKSVTYNTTEIKPVTNVNFDTEKIAKAIKESSKLIKDGNTKMLEVSKLQMALQKAGLDLEEQKQAQDFFKSEKTRQQLTILVLLIGGSYLYKKMRKGKNAK